MSWFKPRDLLDRTFEISVATRLLHLGSGLTGSAVHFAAAYLLLHGIVKILLVVALLRTKL